MSFSDIKRKFNINKKKLIYRYRKETKELTLPSILIKPVLDERKIKRLRIIYDQLCQLDDLIREIYDLQAYFNIEQRRKMKKPQRTHRQRLKHSGGIINN